MGALDARAAGGDEAAYRSLESLAQFLRGPCGSASRALAAAMWMSRT